MNKLLLIRSALIVFWRDLVSPGAGLYLLVIDPKLSGMSAWQAPIVTALLGFPFAARGLTKADDEEKPKGRRAMVRLGPISVAIGERAETTEEPEK